MNMLKKWTPFLLLCLLILPCNAHAAEIGPSGTCGDDLTWALRLDGTLIISGTGDMTDYGPSYTMSSKMIVPQNVPTVPLHGKQTTAGMMA